MYIKRDISQAILKGATQAPVIAIVGPRQSGKSTLAKHLFPNHLFLDMQDAELFEFAKDDPKGFLKTYENEHGLIIDEAQYAPQLFPQIKVETDKNQKNGYYILSGSQNFLLHEKISESLAGRAYFYTLLPFSIHELKESDFFINNKDNQISKGFYPKVYQPNINPDEYYKNYISTYVERDIRTLLNIENILEFKKFLQLCALRIGTTLNITELAANCGVSQPTAKKWLSLMQTSYILFFLPPYHANLGKRIIKSPKIYFYDVGLAMTLMDISKAVIIKKRDIYGALFENMIIVDVIKNINAHNIHPTLSFFRDSNRSEIDLIIESEGHPIPVEIKATSSINRNVFSLLHWFIDQTQSPEKPIIVYGGATAQIRSGGRVLPWSESHLLIPKGY
ncbi:MAG: ATP-binding protein [Candidatus Babeliales bacterium]